MERSRHPVLLYTIILLTVLGWTVNFIVGKIALRHFDPYSLTSFRMILSGLIMVPIYFAMPNRARLARKDIWTFVVLGFFGVLINRGLFVVGLAYTTAGHSALLVATGPILILLLARAHSLEAITRAKVMGMALCFAGVGVLVGGDGFRFHSETLLGDLLTLAATAGFAIYTVLAKKVARQYDTISMNTFCNLAGALMILPLGIWAGARLDWSAIGWEGWWSLAYMVLISSVACYLAFFWALRHVSASRLVAFNYIEPPLAAYLGIVLLGEKFTRSLLIGAALILLGVYLAEFGPARDELPADTAGA